MKQLTFVKIESVMFVGMVEQDKVQPEVQEGMLIGVSINEPLVIERPAMVFVEGEQVSLAHLIARPEVLKVHAPIQYTYLNSDPDFEKFYQQQTSPIQGLTIAK